MCFVKQGANSDLYNAGGVNIRFSIVDVYLTNIPLEVWSSSFAFLSPGLRTYTQHPNVIRVDTSDSDSVMTLYGVIFM